MTGAHSFQPPSTTPATQVWRSVVVPPWASEAHRWGPGRTPTVHQCPQGEAVSATTKRTNEPCPVPRVSTNTMRPSHPSSSSFMCKNSCGSNPNACSISDRTVSRQRHRIGMLSMSSRLRSLDFVAGRCANVVRDRH